jgi:integrase
MGRRAKQPHELTPKRHGARAIVNFRGRQFYLGPWDIEQDRPSAAAVQRLAELVALWRSDPAAQISKPGDTLLIVLWADWRDSPEGAGVSAAAAARAERYLFGSAEAPGPHRYTRATAFRGAELRSWQRMLCGITRPNGDKLLSRDTVSKCVAIVRKCFAWGLIGGHIQYDQYRELELVEAPARGQVKEAKKRRGVPASTVEAVLGHVSAPIAACLRLLTLTGARPSELLGLRCGEIVQGGTLHALSGVAIDLDKHKVWATVFTEHKTASRGYDRVLFFGPKCQAILSPLIAGRAAGDHVFRPVEGTAQAVAKNKSKRVGYGSYKPLKGSKAKRKPGPRYHRTVLLNAVKRACAAAGIPTWTPYQIRHQVGVSVQQKYGREASRVYLGHLVGGATEGYAGADLELAARVASEIG